MSWLFELWNMVKFNFFFYLGVVLGLFGLSFFIPLSYLLVLAWVALATVIKLVLSREKRVKQYLFGLGMVFLLVSLFWAVSVYVGWWLVWGLLLAFVSWRIYKGWGVMMRSVRFVETTLFGKSLDKNNFETGEKPSIYKKKEGVDEE